jgi:Phage integrase family
LAALSPRWDTRETFSIVRDFATSLATGTIQTDASDTTGLFWPATPYARCKGLIKAIGGFAAWCDYEEPGSSPIAPVVVPLVPHTGEHVTAMLRWSPQREMSMLKHISHAPRSTKKSTIDHGASPSGHGPEPVKFFPPEHAERLLWEGYKIPGAEGKSNIFLRYNVRNMMIALLDGWGGLRRSEGLHLWLQDVVEDPNNLDHALVVLNHPSESKVGFTNPVTGAEEFVTRKELLKRQYGLLPRNEVTRGSYHVGWKGMDLDQNYQACIFWIDPDAGSLFWALYWGYLKYVRGPIMARRMELGGRDHPFLFVSANGDESGEGSVLPGEPYSESAYERSHEAAVVRIGLEHRKYLGTTTHGLRHLYGQTLANLGVPPQVIKKGLHHRNYLSQVPYTVPGNAKTNEQLRLAQGMIARGEIRPSHRSLLQPRRHCSRSGSSCREEASVADTELTFMATDLIDGAYFNASEDRFALIPSRSDEPLDLQQIVEDLIRRHAETEPRGQERDRR